MATGLTDEDLQRIVDDYKGKRKAKNPDTPHTKQLENRLVILLRARGAIIIPASTSKELFISCWSWSCVVGVACV